MHRRALVAAMLAASTQWASAQSRTATTHLEQETVLDGVHVDKTTGKASFALLIDWPLENQGTLNAVQRKLSRYYRARKQGFHIQRFPDVNPALPAGLHVFHLPATTASAKQLLSAVERSARRYGFAPMFESRSTIEGPSSTRS